MYFIAYLYIISITTTFKINNKHKLYKLTKSWKKSNKPYISEQKDIFDLHWKCTCTTLLPNRFSAYQYLLSLFLYMPLWWKSIYNKICISKFSLWIGRAKYHSIPDYHIKDEKLQHELLKTVENPFRDTLHHINNRS